MDSRTVRARERLWWSLALSVLVHALVIFVHIAPPEPKSGPSGTLDNSDRPARPRLEASLARPKSLPPALRPPQPAARPESKPAKAQRKPRLTAPDGARSLPAPPPVAEAEAERARRESQRPPLRGQELAQRALAMARDMRWLNPSEGTLDGSRQPPIEGRRIEPLSLEMYFDAFVRKLNRSAAFVKDDPRARGSRKAQVLITLNSDGSLKEYRVLRAGDQAAEIAYIRSVVDRASPFSAFPPDIREARDSLSILMCVYAAGTGGGSGFSRSFDDQDCRD